MARANVILVGAIILAPAIVGAEGYAIYRTHLRTAKRSADSAEPAEPVAEAPPAPAPPIEAPPPPPPPAPRLEAPAAPAPPPGDDTAAVADPVVSRRQRGLYERRRQVIHDADEQVFDTLNLPEAQRAAIRAIDDQYGRALTSLAEAALASDFQNVVTDGNAEQTRRTAIAGVLGPDMSHVFTFAERKAERGVRNRLRPEIVRGY
jgi:type IV secretory pathway VirB10-like protein